jgi:hypothetical protein
MTLPVLPSVEPILANSASVLRGVVLPSLTDDYPRTCTRIVAAALDYAVGLLQHDRGAANRAELDHALAVVAARCGPDVRSLVDADGSPFERASAVLVWGQTHDHPDAVVARDLLHPVLLAQLERETAEAQELMNALALAMRGTDE